MFWATSTAWFSWSIAGASASCWLTQLCEWLAGTSITISLQTSKSQQSTEIVWDFLEL